MPPKDEQMLVSTKDYGFTSIKVEYVIQTNLSARPAHCSVLGHTLRPGPVPKWHVVILGMFQFSLHGVSQ